MTDQTEQMLAFWIFVPPIGIGLWMIVILFIWFVLGLIRNGRL